MKMLQDWFANEIPDYVQALERTFSNDVVMGIQALSLALQECRVEGRKVFICGNGGSCGNAVHLANDFIYGISGRKDSCKQELDVEALSANSSVLTCLANDTGYENIYSLQLDAKGKAGDMLLVLSGSGNSLNVVNAIVKAKALGMKTAAITSFDGGTCRRIADISIHARVDDMQIAEDVQLIVGHICMKYLRSVANQSEASLVQN